MTQTRLVAFCDDDIEIYSCHMGRPVAMRCCALGLDRPGIQLEPAALVCLAPDNSLSSRSPPGEDEIAGLPYPEVYGLVVRSGEWPGGLGRVQVSFLD